MRRRVIRGWLLAGGATGLTDKQIRGVDTLVTAWRGQGGVAVGSPLRGRAAVRGAARRRPDVATASRVIWGLPLVVRPLAWHAVGVAQISSAITPAQPAELYPGDIKSVLLTEEQIQARIAELGAQIGNDYRDLAAETGQDLLLITVLKGAVIFVTDLARAIPLPTQFEFMAVSSYGSSTSSSGVVRILKDLDRDIHDRDVLIVEDVVDSGLTLSWLLRNLTTRHPRSLRVCTLLRKPDAVGANVDIAYVGFDIPNEFVVGYGLDYDERYRDLSYIGTLDPALQSTARASSDPLARLAALAIALLQLPHRGHREVHRLLAGFQRDCGHATRRRRRCTGDGVAPVRFGDGQHLAQPQARTAGRTARRGSWRPGMRAHARP